MGSAKRRRAQQAQQQHGGGGGASTAFASAPPRPSSSSAASSATHKLAQAVAAGGVGHPGEELTPMQVFKKALKFNAGWTKETFPQFLNVVYWLRQILGILWGLWAGFAGSRGAPAVLSFVGLNIMMPRTYYTQYARVDEEDFDPLSLLKEGYQASFGLFMVVWICAFNYFHGHKLADAGAAAAAAGGK